MANVGNKVISYSVYNKYNNKNVKAGDTTSVQLPSIEFLTDTIKGAGILGEIDWPSYYQPGSMTVGMSLRVTGEQLAMLSSADNLEIRWVTDVFDTNNVKVKVDSHKAFIKCVPKKIDEGKLEPGTAQDASFEYEVFAYKRVINGKEVLNIDKFNGIFAINGVNKLASVNAAL